MQESRIRALERQINTMDMLLATSDDQTLQLAACQEKVLQAVPPLRTFRAP